MAVEALNLVAAGCAVVWIVASPTAPLPRAWTAADFLNLAISAAWAVGAVGLLYQKLWAWWLSVLGISMVLTYSCIEVAASYLFLRAVLASLGPIEQLAYPIFGAIVCLCVVLVLLVAVLGLRPVSIRYEGSA